MCLQDTHLLNNDLSSVKQIWHDCYINGSKTNSRGVAVLLNNNFEYKVSKVIRDEDSNILQLFITCDELKLNLINIYAPNRDTPDFSRKVFEAASLDGFDQVIICGDFNLTLDPLQDSLNYNNINNPRARSKVIEKMTELETVDIFRLTYPKSKRYTWRKKNPVKQARLDYFLISRSMIDIVDSVDIKPGYRSDHSIVEMQLSIDNFTCGSGTWKFNNSLLKNQDYLNLINKIIMEEKYKYALPVYDLNHIKDNHITFSSDDDTFLDTVTQYYFPCLGKEA